VLTYSNGSTSTWIAPHHSQEVYDKPAEAEVSGKFVLPGSVRFECRWQKQYLDTIAKSFDLQPLTLALGKEWETLMEQEISALEQFAGVAGGAALSLLIREAKRQGFADSAARRVAVNVLLLDSLGPEGLRQTFGETKPVTVRDWITEANRFRKASEAQPMGEAAESVLLDVVRQFAGDWTGVAGV
jgi:hypothetical protein